MMLALVSCSDFDTSFVFQVGAPVGLRVAAGPAALHVAAFLERMYDYERD